MATPMVFMMGQSPVFVPRDRHFTRQHLWAVMGPETVRFGFTTFAVRLFGEIEELQWTVAPGESVAARQSIGWIEGSESAADLFAPAAGIVTFLNAAVLADPAAINASAYDDGWLLEMRCDALELLGPGEYLAHLQAAWPLAERMLRGAVAAPRRSSRVRRPK